MSTPDGDGYGRSGAHETGVAGNATTPVDSVKQLQDYCLATALPALLFEPFALHLGCQTKVEMSAFWGRNKLDNLANRDNIIEIARDGPTTADLRRGQKIQMSAHVVWFS